jgi:hypothetical protein
MDPATQQENSSLIEGEFFSISFFLSSMLVVCLVETFSSFSFPHIIHLLKETLFTKITKP